jgi:hypothetical protein
LQLWHDAQLQPIDPELLELAKGYAATELSSRETLGNRLAALISVAGALLTLSVAEAHDAASTHFQDSWHTVFSVEFAGAIVALVATILIALRSLGPHLRCVPKPELLRYYGEAGGEIPEIRQDAYKLHVALLDQLAESNRGRAKGFRRALAALIVALIFAAAAAGTVYFASL